MCCREARVERDSVNSVAVEDEPSDPFDRMMVAACVGRFHIMIAIDFYVVDFCLIACPFDLLRNFTHQLYR